MAQTSEMKRVKGEGFGFLPTSPREVRVWVGVVVSHKTYASSTSPHVQLVLNTADQQDHSHTLVGVQLEVSFTSLFHCNGENFTSEQREKYNVIRIKVNCLVL